MTQLIQQTPFWLSITIGIAFIGLLGYVFGVKRENDIPEESEVVGKDLPVGFRFMKDGKVVEVVEYVSCKHCVYAHIYEKGNLSCFSDVSPLCYISSRADEKSVCFKYIDHE